jgi:outer membrane immunogenic protein
MKQRSVAQIAMLGLLLAAPSGVAQAADMAVKAPPMPIVAAPNWSGFYIGGSLGGDWGRRDFVFDTAGTAPSPNPFGYQSGVAGGVFGGAQWQWDRFVLGAEAGYNALDLKNVEVCPGSAFNCFTSANQLWTVGPRAGVTFDQFLVYGTGGYASTRTGYLATAASNGATFDSAKVWTGGWFVGGGVEYMIPAAPGLVVGIDYKHIEADQQSTQPLTPLGVAVTADHFLLSTRYDTVQLRISYKFGWVGPIVARY